MNILDRFKNYLSKDIKIIKIIFISTFIFSLLAHAYAYFNSKFSHDELASIYQGTDRVWKLSIGRFGQLLNFELRGEIVAPWLLGSLSILWLSITIYILIKLLNFNNKVFIILICGILAANNVISATNATYIHEIDTFMLGTLLAVLSVYLFNRNNSRILRSSIILAISISMYQANFQVVIIILMILIIKKSIEKEEFKKILYMIMRAGIVLILAIAIYYLLDKIIINIFDIEVIDNYNSPFKARYQSIKEIIIQSIYSIKSVIGYFLMPNSHNKKIVAISNITLFIITCICIFRIIKNKKIKTNNIITIGLIGVTIPIGVNIIDIISKGNGHLLTKFSFLFIYVLILLIIEKYLESLDKNKKTYRDKIIFGVATLFSINIFSNIIFSNQLYLKKHLESQAMLSLMTRIINRIETTEGYTIGETPIAILGDLAQSDIASQKRVGFDHLEVIGSQSSYWYNLKKYTEYILSYPIKYVESKKETEEIINSIEFKNMKVFPSENSIEFIDGVLVVKIGEEK